MKLLVAVPSNRDWKFGFGYSLVGLTSHLASRGINSLIQAHGNISLISVGRQDFINFGIENSFTHILFLDDDMLFDTEAFDFLWGRNVSLVAANYVTKNQELIKKNNPRPNVAGQNGKMISSVGKKGIEKIDACGLGFSLLNLATLKNIPGPYFEVKWNEKTKSYTGEDVRFCNILREHGIDIYVDHDASKHVSHIGDYFYQENF